MSSELKREEIKYHSPYACCRSSRWKVMFAQASERLYRVHIQRCACIWTIVLTEWAHALFLNEEKYYEKWSAFPVYLEGWGAELDNWEVKGGLASHKLVLLRQNTMFWVHLHIQGNNWRSFANNIYLVLPRVCVIKQIVCIFKILYIQLLYIHTLLNWMDTRAS